MRPIADVWLSYYYLQFSYWFDLTPSFIIILFYASDFYCFSMLTHMTKIEQINYIRIYDDD